jgi:hypothetical protein
VEMPEIVGESGDWDNHCVRSYNRRHRGPGKVQITHRGGEGEGIVMERRKEAVGQLNLFCL